MPNCFVSVLGKNDKTIPVIPVITSKFSEWLKKQSAEARRWVEVNNFKAKSAEFCFIPDKKSGGLGSILLGLKNVDDCSAFGVLPKKLPAGLYHLELEKANWNNEKIERALIFWGLGSYTFTKYKKPETHRVQLVLPTKCNSKYVTSMVKATCFARDLVNLPNQDFGPEELSDIARNLAKRHSAKITEIIGDKLLKENFPAIYAVGKGSSRKPRLIELRLAKHKKAPNITLVGKGVCFDSGGWDLKPYPFMRLMKDDMAGAAYALALADLIMELKLPVNLRVIIPIVENLLADISYKPGDVITMRNGKTVEIHNTDAEGRLILADALTYASEEKTDLLLDFATLTGAARIALGNDINALFTDNEELALEISALAKEEQDPIWRLPLYEPYWDSLRSCIADFSNCSDSRYGGAINAALFLKRFVKDDIKWAHFDIASWNDSTKPGRPEGGDIFGLRTMLKLIEKIV